MPSPPVMASGSRDPEKRPRPLPRGVRDMIAFMVRGDPADEDCRPLDFIEAGKLAGYKPDRARLWLDRGDFRTALRAERKAFREAVCAGNEGALQRVRDGSKNGMVVVHAVRTLEHLADEEPTRHPGAPMVPGFAILVVAAPGAAVSSAQTIDGTARVVDERSTDHPSAQLDEE